VSDTDIPSARASVPREFTEFLIELSVALHKHAMYPLGHPSLLPAAEAVSRQAERLLGDRELLAFGIARHTLIIDGVATDPKQPVLRRLAEGLHRHHLGAVSLLRGLRPSEMSTALHALAAEPDRDGTPRLARGELPGCEHVRLHPLTFQGLTIVSEAGDDAANRNSRAAELWIGLAQAALAGESGAAGDRRFDRPADRAAAAAAAAVAEPAHVADAIDRHHGTEAYDQVVVGYLLQIAGELKTATGAEAEALRGRTGTLISALQPETLRRLVQMGGNASQRNTFVLDATHGMAADAVVDIVKAAAEANGQTISHGLVRMLTKLSAHADAGQAAARPAADTALREQVRSLLGEWQLADPNPDDYRQMLHYLATSPPDERDGIVPADDLNALRLVQMSLEIGSAGPLVDRAIGTCLKEGGVPALVALLENAPAESGLAADRLRARLTQPLAIGTIASHEPLDEGSLDYLMPSLSVDGYGTLLDVLGSSQSRVTRRKLLDRLSRTALDVAPLIGRRLQEDDRWYVQRNMLLLLARLQRVPEGFALSRWTGHAEARVRAEALRLQMELPRQREAALRTAFNDPDPRVVRVGVAAAQQECPPRLLRFLAGIAQGLRVPEDLRILAVQALGNSRDRGALDGLLPLVDGGRNVFGRQRLASKTVVMLAAMRVLASVWRNEPRASALVALGSASPDDDIRSAAR
jgi:hypothetical protein